MSEEGQRRLQRKLIGPQCIHAPSGIALLEINGLCCTVTSQREEYHRKTSIYMSVSSKSRTCGLVGDCPS